MKKEITIAAITFLLATTPAFAQSSHANNDHDKGNSDEVHTNNVSVKGIQIQNVPLIRSNEPDRDNITSTPTTVPSVSPAISPVISPSITPCNPDDNWKNHGAYVSCVAHLHEGGHFVANAAHQDNDKDDHSSITPSVTPSTSPEPSMSPEPSASPSVSPVPSVSPTPITSAMSDLEFNESPVHNIGVLFNRFVKFFSRWI